MGIPTVESAREIAFEETKDGLQFLLCAYGDGESGVAEDLALQIVGRGEELRGGGAKEGVGVAVAVTGCVVAAGDEFRARAGECGDSLMELLAA